jgi:hypothetical protein
VSRINAGDDLLHDGCGTLQTKRAFAPRQLIE